MMDFIAKCRKYFFKIVLILVVCFALTMVAKLVFFVGLFFVVENFVSRMTGFEIFYTRSMSIFLTALILLAMPTVLSYFILGRNKKKTIIILLVSFIVMVGFVRYRSTHVYFDRITGASIAYYVKTGNGYLFSREGGYDPLYGTEYKLVTREIVAEIMGTKLAENQPKENSMFDDVKTLEELVGYSKPSTQDQTYKAGFMKKLGELCSSDYDCKVYGDEGVLLKLEYIRRSTPYHHPNPSSKSEVAL